MRILLIEDHRRLAESITHGLARYGFGVDSFATAAKGIDALHAISFDAIVLDLGLPDRDGFDVLRELRKGNSTTPILILTARDDVADRVTNLDAGADDYVVKPIAIVELAARLRALLRRPGRALATILAVGNVQLDVSSRQVTINGTTVHFPARETEAMEILMRREGEVVSRSSLQNGLYGLSKNVTPNGIEVLISRLRRRLTTFGADCAIHTLHGIGYLLKKSNA